MICFEFSQYLKYFFNSLKFFQTGNLKPDYRILFTKAAATIKLISVGGSAAWKHEEKHKESRKCMSPEYLCIFKPQTSS